MPCRRNDLKVQSNQVNAIFRAIRYFSLPALLPGLFSNFRASSSSAGSCRGLFLVHLQRRRV